MDLWNGILQKWQIHDWGITPVSLLAPCGLLVMILTAGRLQRGRGPRMEGGDVGGGVIIAVIIGAAFLWIFAGIALLERSFR